MSPSSIQIWLVGKDFYGDGKLSSMDMPRTMTMNTRHIVAIGLQCVRWLRSKECSRLDKLTIKSDPDFDKDDVNDKTKSSWYSFLATSNIRKVRLVNIEDTAFIRGILKHTPLLTELTIECKSGGHPKIEPIDSTVWHFSTFLSGISGIQKCENPKTGEIEDFVGKHLQRKLNVRNAVYKEYPIVPYIGTFLIGSDTISSVAMDDIIRLLQT
jgi:hypothetical protein